LEESKFSVFKIIVLHPGGSSYTYYEELSNPEWYSATIILGLQGLTYIILSKGIYET